MDSRECDDRIILINNEYPRWPYSDLRTWREKDVQGACPFVSRIRPEYLGFLTVMLEGDNPIRKEVKTGKMELLHPEELLHRRRKKSSTIFCSQYDPNGWYNQLGGDESPLAEAILDRIKHDAYKINIVPTDPSNYRSMREVYGLDPAKSE